MESSAYLLEALSVQLAQRRVDYTDLIKKYGDARVREAMEGAEDKIESAIKGVYSEDIWLPLPEEQERAKDAVAADVLRTLAPALAKIAVEAIQN